MSEVHRTEIERNPQKEGGSFIGKVMVLTLSDSEEYIMNKVMAVLSEEQTIEHVHVPDEPVLTFSNLEIRPRRRQILLDDRQINLTTREFDVLYYLARYAGHVLTARQIYEAVSSEYAVGCDYHSVESSIYSIRRKLGHDVILTVRSCGYKFNQDI